MKICSIVVLYEPNKEEIANILGYYDYVDKVYVLDNSFKSREEITKNILGASHEHIEEKLKYIYFGENIGLCKALNYAMKLALEEECEWALIMDEDSTFNTNVVEVYKNYISKNDCSRIGVLAPVHIHDRNLEHHFNGQRNVAWSMTSGCFYNIKIFWDFLGFKEELFVDGLDIDYCYKIGRNGYSIVELSEARIDHFPGKTKVFNFMGKRIKYGVASPWRYYMQARAITWLILEYRSGREVIRYGIKWGKVILLFQNKREYVKQMIKGTKEGINMWKATHAVSK